MKPEGSHLEVPSDRLSGVALQLRDEGREVFLIDGSQIVDYVSFLAEVQRAVPLETELNPAGRSFDALVDSMSGGLHDRQHSAVIWDKSWILRDTNPELYGCLLYTSPSPRD